MLPTLMKNPPRLNPELGRRHEETAKMLRDMQRKAGIQGHTL
jgi:hypothetical protein